MADQTKDARDGEQGEKQEQKGQHEQRTEERRSRSRRWPWIAVGVVVAVFVAVVTFIIFVPHARQQTDDAYVTAHYAVVAPRVSGQVASVVVEDNQTVHAGQLLVEIDDRDLRAALHQAEATLAADLAQVDQAKAQVDRQPSMIRQAAAQVSAAEARRWLSDANAARYANLAESGAGTLQQRQQAVAQLRQERAGVRSAGAELSSERHQLDALRATHRNALAKVEADRGQVEQARLNLSYARIVAPIDGTVDQRSVQVGNYVSPGAAMLIVVPLHQVFIEANYRELALRHMSPGQSVRIHVDAYDIWLDGVLQSLPAASGSALSPIAPNNATGNFTKIVQRLPVKITVSPGQPLARLLRIGMSVETTVDTKLADVVAAHRDAADRVR